MGEINPLKVYLPLPSPATRDQIRNRSGRPSLKNATKFGPQPKSIVAQMLSEVKTKEVFTDKEVISLVDHPDDFLGTEKSEDHSCPRVTIVKRKQSLVCDNKDNSGGAIMANIIQITQQSECAVIKSETETKDTEEKDIVTITDQSKAENSSMISRDEQEKNIAKDKLYTCDFPNCSYSCKLSSNLIKHKRVHTNEKPYLCDKCSFRSNFVNSLKAHKRTHTAERPYQCVYCSYKCNSSSNLKKHCRFRHLDQWKINQGAEGATLADWRTLKLGAKT